MHIYYIIMLNYLMKAIGAQLLNY